ncbi:MAG: hypothetical protein AAGC85_18805 [Bacteroidota bacterium]
MKKLISLIIGPGMFFVSFMLVTFCQANPHSFIETFTLDETGRLETKTFGGDIRISGNSTNKVEVKTDVSHNGIKLVEEDPIMETFYEYYDLQIEKEGNTILAKAVRKGKLEEGHFAFGISFTIEMPSQAEIKAHANNGNIYVSDQSGQHTYTTNSGNVLLERVTGSTLLVTSNGNVEKRDCVGDSDIRISGGELIMNRSEGDVSVSSTGENVILDHSGGSIFVRSSGGDVVITGKAKSMDVISNGRISIKLDYIENGAHLNTNGDVKAQIKGDKGLDLSLKAQRVEFNTSKDFKGTRKDSFVSGSVDGGGIPVNISATGGEISLSVD